MNDVSTTSNDTTQNLTLDTVNTLQPRSHSRQSELSLEDLSSNDGKEEEDEHDGYAVEADAEEEAYHSGHDTQRMKAKLHSNLKMQQEHYARQRKLFEDLRTTTMTEPSATISPSMYSSSSHSSTSVHPVRKVSDRQAPRKRHEKSMKLQMRLQQELTGNSLTRQSVSHIRTSPQSFSLDDDDEIRRIKEKALTEYHRHSTRHTSGVRGRPQADFIDEMQQQEASNDALRKQLELLRRLQVENNRFRHENRSLREENEAITEDKTLLDRELKRLREEIKDLDQHIQQDQVQLAAAANTTRKLKQCQKQLSGFQTDNEKLHKALQEAMDAQEQQQLINHNEVQELTLESNRLKRNLKQMRVQETKLAEEMELYKSTIGALEAETMEMRAQMQQLTRENNELSSKLTEKTEQCESVEASATACVERMKAGMEAVQKAYTQEREKRKKVETLRNSLQNQVATLERDGTQLRTNIQELENYIQEWQEKFKEQKRRHQEQVELHAEKLEESIEQHRQDAKTIGNLRRECEVYEQQLATARVEAVEAKQRMAEELRDVRKSVEALRIYVDNALRAPIGTREDMDNDQQMVTIDTESQRTDRWSELPELQFLHGALTAMRNEMMVFVHEFQRTRHLFRQQGNKLTLSQERVVELEHLHSEDNTKMKELRDQCVLAEEAREITSKEKLEILKWSQQTCEKNELIETELSKCDRFLMKVLKKARGRRECTSSDDVVLAAKGSDHPSLARFFAPIEQEIDALLATRYQLQQEVERQKNENEEQQDQLQALRCEMDNNMAELKQTMTDIEMLHAKNMEEQKLRCDQLLTEVEEEKSVLTNKLRAEVKQVEELTQVNHDLQQQVDGFKEDFPILATVLHLFVLVVPPLILQVSDLLRQKRLLLRENAEYTHTYEQVECIGQVLKELVPMSITNHEKIAELERRRRFRRVLIAVFAANRLQRCFSQPYTGRPESSIFGVCTSLKRPKKSRSQSVSIHHSPPSTAIKVLPPKPTLSRLNLRQLLERLKSFQVTDKVAEVVDLANSSTALSLSTFGNFIVQVIVAMDPSTKEVLVENTSGAFHCQALLERRRRSIKKKTSAAHHENDVNDSFESASGAEDDISTVDLIRKRILALGKRVEDLHFQRNSLQKENYEYQFQLEEQANSLKQTEVLIAKMEDLQHEMDEMRHRNNREQESMHRQLEAKEREIQKKDDELFDVRQTVVDLEGEIARIQTQITEVESDKTNLDSEVARLKQTCAEHEEESNKAAAAIKRQEEELRSLKQTAKRAHELYQKVNWRLEQELQERANLQAVVEHMKHQKEHLEKKLHYEKLDDVKKSFSDDDDSASVSEKRSDNHSGSKFISHKLSTSPTWKQNKQTSFLDAHDTCIYHTYEKPEKRRQNEKDMDDDEKEEDNFQEECQLNESRSPSPTLSTKFSSRRSSHAMENNGKFLSEWRRLDVSDAFADNTRIHPHQNTLATRFSKPNTVTSDQPLPFNETKSACSPTAKTTAGSLAVRMEIQSNQRRIEIDRMNSAVHDYMDKIDEKLQQMYGIPPSSSRKRWQHEDELDDKDIDEEEDTMR